MRVVITGANGQLGNALVEKVPGGFKIISLTREDFDLRERNKLYQFLIEVQPEIVINTAAFHNTTRCEEMPEVAMLVNSGIPVLIARIINKWSGIFVFISTDYVFNGEKRGDYYYEDDIPAPINIYGLSKYTGEYGVKLVNSRSYIIRTSSLFGKTSKPEGNFVQKIINKAKHEDHIEVVNDIFMTPSFAGDVANRIWEIIQKRLPYGIYHVSNTGVTNWYEYSLEIIKLSGLKTHVIPTSYTKIDSKLRRPLWSPLGSKKLPPLRHWKEALKEFISKELR